ALRNDHDSAATRANFLGSSLLFLQREQPTPLAGPLLLTWSSGRRLVSGVWRGGISTFIVRFEGLFITRRIRAAVDACVARRQPPVVERDGYEQGNRAFVDVADDA